VLCVTGAETSLGTLASRLDREAPLHEVRLDHLGSWGEGLWPLLERHAAHILLCCRPKREGGAYVGDETERLAALERGARLGVRWIDVEGDVPDAALDELPSARLVRSRHRFEARDDGGGVVTLARELSGLRGAVVKLAVAVDDASHLDALQQARAAIDGDAVFIGMGPAGLLSRARYPCFGSAWTYVAASRDAATAPGQLAWEAAMHQGLPAAASAPFAALVGGPQVLGSPGPRIYPPLFARRGIVARSYLPVVTTDLARALPLLRAVGAVGLSVTMPLKSHAAELGQGDAVVLALGAANSMRRSAEGWQATNTDVAGVELPLREHVNDGERLLVLGAGGAAAAAVEAGRRLGLAVALSSRRREAATSLASRFEGVETIAWDDRGAWKGEVLINATPVAGTQATPWPDVALPAKVVFDLALGRSPALALRGQAHAAGAHFLPPEAMWRAQGAAQVGWFFDLALQPEDLGDTDEVLMAPKRG